MNRLAPIVLLVITATPCAGQQDSTPRYERSFCWRGKPAPACHGFLITEAGYDYVWATTRTSVHYNFSSDPSAAFTRDDFESRLIWTIGPMFNTAPGRAVGATISASPNNGGTQLALEARRRSWGPGSGALDLTAGVLRTNVPMPGNSGTVGYGLTTGVLLVEGDLVNVNGRLDVLLGAGRPRFGTSVGVGTGSYAAVGVTVLGIALLAALLASLDNY
jgi:hypothetical protein